VNQQERIGFTDPVSAHPRFQGMGLVRALLLTGMRLLKERGMNRARLGTSGNNIRMQRSAESVGFKVEYKTIWFSKEVN
jgi:ribosomal protein S18 acetylase RimI-like enzyme